jgi:hypothetical protein
VEDKCLPRRGYTFELPGRRGPRNFGPILGFGCCSKTLARCGVARQQTGRYSSGVFIRGASFTKKLLELFVGVSGGTRRLPRPGRFSYPIHHMSRRLSSPMFARKRS